MKPPTHPKTLVEIPEYHELGALGRSQLSEMAEEMLHRGLPPAVVSAGIRSTALLLLEQQRAGQNRIDHTKVREFLDSNGGKAVSRSPRGTPRRESKLVARERLLERLNALISAASTARRKHEILRMRRDMLGLHQGHIRRTLGADGAAICAQMNQWLSDVADRLNGGGM